jgi:signal transduction histidine kinase
VDAALAGTALAGGLLLLSLGAANTIWPPADTDRKLYVPPLLAACVAVLLRRRAPGGSLALGTAAAITDVALGASLGTLLVYTQVLYDACVYGPPKMWRWLLRISIAATVLGAATGLALARAWHGVSLGVVFALIAVFPVLTGISVRQYRDQAAAERARARAERERAEQTARLAEVDRHQAITAERTRMARELHDVVANHLSAVAIHATAALSVRDLDGDAVRRALTVIRSSSVQGLAEMRQMIELLRDAEEGPDPPARAGLEQADRLVEGARAAGLAVAVRTTGSPRPLPVGVDLAAYRILQESLTNALKHGAGRAEVCIGYEPGQLALTVDSPLPDDPHGAPAGARNGEVPSSGAGLIGMRERTELLAGRFSAGPLAPEALWRVHAVLPAEASGDAA